MRRLPAHVPLPLPQLRFLGEDDERLLDAGCGYGRLALGLVSTGFEGSYVGFDILERHVRWCREHLTPAHRAAALAVTVRRATRRRVSAATRSA